VTIKDAALDNITKATFRANPALEFTSIECLDLRDRELINKFGLAGDCLGILHRRAASPLTGKSVSKDVALLWFQLQKAAELAIDLRKALGDDCGCTLSRLLLEGILEIEWSGQFLSGFEAHEAIFGKRLHHSRSNGIALMSIQALKYAQALALEDPERLSARMYFFNRVPASSDWRRRYPDSHSVSKYLGIGSGGPNTLRLSKDWISAKLDPLNYGWNMWFFRGARPKSSRSEPTYKLYVSPACDFVRTAFNAALGVLPNFSPTFFKVGRNVYSLLRPDKMVAYFRTAQDLLDAAAALANELEGCPPHGAPFTAEISVGGLLSWGIDPPRERQSLAKEGGESWRLWITNRLAVSLLTAMADKSASMEPWQYALQQMRLYGVDPETWVPPVTNLRGLPLQ
jgi:hypothetical protein